MRFLHGELSIFKIMNLQLLEEQEQFILMQ